MSVFSLDSVVQGGASVLGNIIGGIFGKKSNDSANATNIKIAQMNNEWSEKMLDKQNRYNIEQFNREVDLWNKSNEYNSAKNQAQRFREAGLNPALMMGSGNAGTASSASPSGNSVGLPSPSQATVKPFDYSSIGSAIQYGVETMAMLARNTAEVNNLNTQSKVAKAKAEAEVEKLREESRNIKFKNEMNDISKDLQLTQMNEDYLTTLQQRATAEQMEKYYKALTLMQNKELYAFDDRLKQDLAVMASQVKLNNFNAQSEIGKIVDTLKNKGYKLTKQDEKRIFKALKLEMNNHPFKGMTPTGAAAAIGAGIGSSF